MVAILLVGCSHPNPGVAPTAIGPNQFTQQFAPIDGTTVTALTEVSHFAVDFQTAPVAAIAYTSETNVVVAAFGVGANFLEWDLLSGQLAANHDLGINSNIGMAMNVAGTTIIGATSHDKANVIKSGDVEHVAGLGLWDTRTGALIRCISFPCNGSASPRPGFIGATIDSTGNWVLIYSESAINVLDLSGQSASRLSMINDPNSAYLWQIRRVAIDSLHHRFAVLLLEGGIWLDTFSGSNLPYRILVKGAEHTTHVIRDAEFDPAGKQLAVISDDRLLVYAPEGQSMTPNLESTISQGVAVRFDQTGNLLFVAAQNRLSVWSTKNAVRLTEFVVPGITTLGVSQDNRLLLWGDEHGAVHIWAIRPPWPK